MIGQADNQDDADHHNYHLFPIDEFSAKGIAEESERQLTDDVANVGSRVDSAAKEERVGGGFHGWFG